MATRNGTKKDNTTSKVIGGGTGAVGGAAAGTAIGAAAGPVGMAVGGVAGAVAGTAIAAAVDPAEETKHWEGEYTSRPYYVEGTPFKEYRPAYVYGVVAANKYTGQPFSEVEKRMGRNWPKERGDSSLTWGKAKGAAQDAYERTMRLHEERLKVDKEQVSKGEAVVRKEVVTERQKVEVPVEREEVVIKRKPASGPARPGGMGTDEKASEIRIPVKEERVKVTKETVPVEDVTVGRRKVSSTHKVDEPVRKERLRTETKGGAPVRETR
jgi:uncharacterized protein (TIGR02271 family)